MRVLAVGAHPADIELGCGGALLAHRDRGDEIHLIVMSGCASKTIEHEQLYAADQLGATVHWAGFEDGSIPEGRESVAAIESVVIATGSEVVYGHFAEDSHQDHRFTARATLAAARRCRQVLSYESATSVAFTPLLFVDIEGRLGHKLQLVGVHRTQLAATDMFDLGIVAAQARFRGAQARLSTAEGFQSERFVWTLAPAPTHDVDFSAPFGARSMVQASPRPTRGDIHVEPRRSNPEA